jgi:hypothetical protein
MDDFQAVLKEKGVVSVRMYLGLRIDENNHIQEKMLCVGVDSAGRDIIPARERAQGQGADDPEDDSGIFDFSHPCPPLCNTASSVLSGGNPS